jgi:hypothetical protein
MTILTNYYKQVGLSVAALFFGFGFGLITDGIINPVPLPKIEEVQIPVHPRTLKPRCSNHYGAKLNLNKIKVLKKNLKKLKLLHRCNYDNTNKLRLIINTENFKNQRQSLIWLRQNE